MAECPPGSTFISYGQFADGTPITDDAMRAWRALSTPVKTEQNLSRMEGLVISWNDLVRFRAEEQFTPHQHAIYADENPALETPCHRFIPTFQGKQCIIVFMHVPKVGGTTLESLLSKNYKPNYLIHVNSPALEKRPHVLFKHEELPSLIMGHHKASSILYQLLNRPILHMTMLREPISRVISYYDYLHTDQEHSLHERVSQMSLQEFVKSDEFVELENAQALRLIGRLHKQCNGASISKSEILEKAKYTLTKRMTLVGITEEYTRFLIMLKRLLKLKDIFYVRQNTSKQKTDRASVSESILQIIRDRNAVDIELYHYAKVLFEERCAQLGIHQSHVNTFNHLNQAYQDLIVASMNDL